MTTSWVHFYGPLEDTDHIPGGAAEPGGRDDEGVGNS